MLISTIDMYTPSVRALAVSPDGAYLACPGKDASLRIWDLAKGGLVATCENLTTTVQVPCLPAGNSRIYLLRLGRGGEMLGGAGRETVRDTGRAFEHHHLLLH